jgi:Tol biopolymer transport system component
MKKMISVAVVLGACGGNHGGGHPDAAFEADGRQSSADAPLAQADAFVAGADAPASADARGADGPLEDAAVADAGIADAGPADAAGDDAGPPSDWIQVSVDSSGAEGPHSTPLGGGISADGRYTTFISGNPLAGVATGASLGDIGYLHDRVTGKTTFAVTSTTGGAPNGMVEGLAMTPDARFIAFESYADNLVAGDPTPVLYLKCFVEDRKLGTVVHVDLTPAGAVSANSCGIKGISDDGKIIMFESDDDDLVAGDTNQTWDVFVRDMTTGTTRRISVDSTGADLPDGASADAFAAGGRYAVWDTDDPVFSGDTNGISRVFVTDLETGTIVRASVSSAGVQGDGDSYADSITPDGRYLVFDSAATNLVAGDTNTFEDAFLRDLTLGTTIRVDVSASGAEAPTGGVGGGISSDGRYVEFSSDSDGLVAGDTNGLEDAFLRDLVNNTTLEYTKAGPGGTCTNMCGGGEWSRDGLTQVIITAQPFVGTDTNFQQDEFEGPALP